MLSTALSLRESINPQDYDISSPSDTEKKGQANQARPSGRDEREPVSIGIEVHEER